MVKQFTKEKKGRVGSSLSADGIFTIPHSPEQEQATQKLIERLQPIFLQGLVQSINLYIDENINIQQGDIITYVTNYINNYYQTIGVIYSAGNGIQILGSTIGVRDGDGLDASSGPLNIDLVDTNPGLKIVSTELDIKAGDGITTDDDGTKVDLADAITTTGDGGGLKLTDSDGTGKLQVAPEDFLYTGE
jgi:hypothetical protein